MIVPLPQWQTRFLQIMSLFMLILTVYVNYLSNAVPFNGKTAQMISAQYDTLITPAPFTFLIWIVIYIGLAVYIFWQISPIFNLNMKMEVEPIVNKIGLLFILSCIFNCSWLLAWHYDYLFLSIIIMIGLLLSIIEIYKRLESFQPLSRQVQLVCKLPFGLYMGWLSVALTANIASYFTKIGWDGFGLDNRIWAILLIITCTIIAFWVIFRFQNFGYGVAVTWALIGIGSINMDVNNRSITYVAIILLCILSLFIATVQSYNRKIS